MEAHAATQIKNNSKSLEIASQFMDAVASGDVKLLEHFLDDVGFQVDQLVKYHGQVLYPLELAFEAGNLDVVKLLLDAQADVNIENSRGYTLLHVAAQNGDSRMVKILVRSQADMDLQQKHSGATPLYLASQNGHHQVVDSLIKASADANIPTSTGASPVYIAAQYGHSRIVDSLISAQADVNVQGCKGGSAMYIASQNGHLRVVESLLKAPADVNIRLTTGETPLYAASQNGHQSVVNLLIEAQADVNLSSKAGVTPLHMAAQIGNVQIARMLVNVEADVDLQLLHATPLYLAASKNHHQVVDLLIQAQADVNLTDNDGASPLYIAAQSGHERVVKSLIAAQADVTLSRNASTARNIAAQQGHYRIVELLDQAHADETLQADLTDLTAVGVTDDDTRQDRNITGERLSALLHTELTKSGFVNSRAAMQGAMSDVLQDILRARQDSDDIFVVGSYSEGWGNSLATLDGRTDIESDIDVMQLITGRIFHLANACKCEVSVDDKVECCNGHIPCSGFASNPARQSKECDLRPAVDIVDACRLCCYPPIAPLLPHRVAKSNIPQSVLQSLQRELTSSPCHVVHAAAPGQAGKQLRVSTTFLEKRLLRSLSTLQGQLFVTLKYLVKKVISRKVQGLKAYHMKTITFRMLEETPADEWKPENLVNLTRRSLQMLLDSVKRSSGNADGRIMDHFFLCDAGLYLKGADHNSTQDISAALNATIEQLPQLLLEFIDSLKPVTTSGTFYFQPFQILPILQPIAIPRNPDLISSIGYHEIYSLVRESVLRLSQEDCKQDSLPAIIGILPDCVRSVRDALRVLACLKFGYHDGAVEFLSQCRGHEVSSGIAWPADRSVDEATDDFVWQHLGSGDSTWKFCFEFYQRPRLNFLPGFLAECFPLQLSSSRNHYYINFDALLHFLRLQLTKGDGDNEWVRKVLQRENSDVQETLVSVICSRDWDLTLRQLRKIESVAPSLSGRLKEELFRVLKT